MPPEGQSSPGDVPPPDWLAQPAWLLDAPGRVRETNAAWRAYAGLEDPAAATGAVHPEDAAILGRLTSGSPARLELRLRSRDGRYRWFACDASPLAGGWLAVWLDVHEHHLSHARASRFYRVTDALATALTPDEVADVITDVAIEAMGASAGGLMLRDEEGRSFQIVRSRGYPPEVVDLYRSVPVDSPLPAAVAARAGAPVWVEELEPAAATDPEIAAAREKSGNRSAAIIPVASGSVLGALTLSFAQRHDFNEEERDFLLAVGRLCGQALHRARLYEEVTSSNAALEERVRERTSELSEKNRLLEARHEDQETFAYTVSHDLRQPLLSIQGMAELLEDAVKRLDAEEAAFLTDRITRNAARMGDLLSALLNISRAGRQVEEVQAVNLSGTMIAVLADLQARLAVRGVVAATPQTWPTVLYGPNDAYRLLLNAVANAVRFSGRPGEPPRVVMEADEADGWVTLRVHDNGPGVPAEYREKVFGIFQKLDPKTEGSGVGLAIVRRIAERYGGRTWLDDSPLGGACLSVTMPLATGE
ncbi:MAG TPA: ATP-binding protein [Deinococcales bacterium]|nr:ATP-binding protein [Deinococcales bacterium]